MPTNEQVSVDALAQEIRRVDGNHDLGAGALAEALMPFILSAAGNAEPVAWEAFCDASYYDMWCVRPVGETTFGNGYHLVNGDEAKDLAARLSAHPPALEPVKATPGIEVSIKTMKLSGDREEYYVSIQRDGREITPHKYPQGYRNRAEYDVASWRHVLLNEPKPSLADPIYRDPPTPEAPAHE